MSALHSLILVPLSLIKIHAAIVVYIVNSLLSMLGKLLKVVERNEAVFNLLQRLLLHFIRYLLGFI